MNEHSPIHEKQQSIIANIANNFNQPTAKTPDLEKGDLSESLSYGSNKILLEKTGKEMKQGISKKILECKVEADHYMKDMKEALSKCPHSPMSEFDNYIFKGCKDKMEYIPKRFSWDEIRKHTKTANEVVVSAVEQPVMTKEESQENYYEKYNMYARKYIRKCVDHCFLNVIHDGLVDKKKYQLSAEQSINLGL